MNTRKLRKSSRQDGNEEVCILIIYPVQEDKKKKMIRNHTGRLEKPGIGEFVTKCLFEENINDFGFCGML